MQNDAVESTEPPERECDLFDAGVCRDSQMCPNNVVYSEDVAVEEGKLKDGSIAQ